MDAHGLWIVPTLPLAVALILAVFGGILPRRAVAVVGCGGVGVAGMVALVVAAAYLRGGSPAPTHQILFTWIDVGTLHVSMGLTLDPLSLVMMLLVTFVGFLIHLYSVDFMAGDPGYARFFCYLELFVGSMLVLVLGDNLLSLYLGWEGVGLCSYLLIGFWYEDPANGAAARKAFIVTRVGDTAMAVGLFLLFWHVGTLDIAEAMAAVGGTGASAVGAGFVPLPAALVTAIALLLLGGAVGKSAQIPLHTWLPDAMAGPSPVSALIHAATMVTAGVYLIARTHVLFEAAPAAMQAVAGVGAVTALYASLCALAQNDLKRILAWSTISQIGYMFLALGVGAWWAALFHLVTHAFFKSLLFLSAGMVIQALGEEHDIHRMGGLVRSLPVAAATFFVAACSLAALPLVTAGFYSKDAILAAAATSARGSGALFAAGLVAAVLTGLYIFRAWFVAFVGAPRTAVVHPPGPLMRGVCIVLAFFSVTAGFIGMPPVLGGFAPFAAYLGGFLGTSFTAATHGPEASLLMGSALASLTGIGLAGWIFGRPGRAPVVASPRVSPSRDAAWRFLHAGMGFDWLYQRILVRPYAVLATTTRQDFIDFFYAGLAAAAGRTGMLLATTTTGRVRNYATGLLIGALLMTFLLFTEWRR